MSAQQPADGGRSRRGLHTRAVHLPLPPLPAQRPVGLPTYRTSAFVFETAEDYADVLNDRAAGYVYSRLDNPTVDAFAAGVASLEGAPAAQAFASGMAAISTTLLSLLSAGDHMVAQTQVYGGTYSILARLLPRLGVEVTMVDGADVDSVAAAMRPTTKVLYTETVANPALMVADLPALAEVAHGVGAVLVVDSTLASPVVCRPLEWGADLVIHSATKYLGGHTDATGGVVCGDVTLIAPLRLLRSDLGGSLAPDEAFLLHRGLATLPLRVERHCANALALALAVEQHPKVEAVSYPGLSAHQQHALAGKLFDQRDGVPLYGGIVTVSPRGGRAAGLAFCNGLRLAENATSLGGTVSKVSHVASTTHRQLDDDALLACGIAPSTVRISVGIEDAGDLIEDVTRSLDAL